MSMDRIFLVHEVKGNTGWVVQAMDPKQAVERFSNEIFDGRGTITLPSNNNKADDDTDMYMEKFKYMGKEYYVELLTKKHSNVSWVPATFN